MSADHMQIYFSFPNSEWANAEFQINRGLKIFSKATAEHSLVSNATKSALI